MKKVDELLTDFSKVLSRYYHFGARDTKFAGETKLCSYLLLIPISQKEARNAENRNRS
jgi:hypothetical protein